MVYDEALSKAWRNYQDKRQAMNDERGRIAQMIFGEPKQNYENARANLLSTVGVFLYNRWKKEARGNLEALQQYLQDDVATRQILQLSEVTDAAALLNAIVNDTALKDQLYDQFSHEGRKLLDAGAVEGSVSGFVAKQLVAELNMLIANGALDGDNSMAANRRFLNSRLPGLIPPPVVGAKPVVLAELSVLDILLNEELRADFILECKNLLLFDSVYDRVIDSLDSVAAEAQASQALSQASLVRLLDQTLTQVMGTDEPVSAAREQLFDWHQRVMKMPKGVEFFRTVEEWKKLSFAHLADALFVVVTHVFGVLTPSLIAAERDGKTYQGKIAPRNIGRRKDFWNRLDMAYNDLQMQDVLRLIRKDHQFTYNDIIEQFFEDWEPCFDDLLSSDPCSFPGFRVSIESALNKGLPPCGVVTGFANVKAMQNTKVGVVMSNVQFQAGAFDMASAEKVIRLLLECAEQHLPVVCFISSGGMQTKEGAGALFSMAAVNDRITRFVRDHDLPMIVFGYGDCTGGAQASFVTHPLVQTYYWSGTSMPFAGQIVVPSNLPLRSIMSNYLSANEGAMQGLVKHPFYPTIDESLRGVDATIPVADETVDDVMTRILQGRLVNQRPVVVAHRPVYTDQDLVRPVRKVLIHARGCTAAKLIRIAQKQNIQVVLVQSDPDMESAAVDQLTDNDTLVCIGGNTPDESYLNAQSVLLSLIHI